MQKSEPKIKIQVYCHTGFSGCNHDYIIPNIKEFDKKEWESMKEDEQEAILYELTETNMANNIEYGAYVIEDENEE